METFHISRRLKLFFVLAGTLLLLGGWQCAYAAESNSASTSTPTAQTETKKENLISDSAGVFSFTIKTKPDSAKGTNGTVTLSSAAEIHKQSDQAFGTFVIPDTVTKDGSEYDVVGIDANAFGSVTTIHAVIIPDSVQKIDTSAFLAEGVTTAQAKESGTNENITVYCNEGSEAQTFAKAQGCSVKTDGLQISLSADSIEAGQTATAKVVLPDFITSSAAAQWSSADKSIATVDDSGNVTAVKEGTTTITATSQGLNASAKIAVTAAQTAQASASATPSPSPSVSPSPSPSASPSATATPSPSTTVENKTDSGSDENAISTQSVTAQSAPSVKYQAHVAYDGWQNQVANGNVAGTTGKGIQMEALKVQITGDSNLGVSYRAHVKNIGWQNWTSNNGLAGTEGEGLQMEAIEMKLTGSDASKYSIYYRVHVKNYGWMGWVKDGESAGTTGLAYRAEAVQIVLRSKDAGAPGNTDTGFLSSETVIASSAVNVRSQVQNEGWLDWVSGGNTSGTTGKGLQMEAFQTTLTGPLNDSQIQYNSYVEDVGWQGWKANGSVSGTVGQGKQIEAVQFQLTGTADRLFDVYYRVHAKNYGWMGWAKNGEWAGTSGGDIRAEAIQVKLVPKGSSAPGSTANAYLELHRDYAQDLIDVANSQVGYEESNDWTKYGQWYQDKMNANGFAYGEWCAMFVSWCANQAGIPEDVIPCHAYCPSGTSWFGNQGEYQLRGYVPEAGDIVYYDWNFDGTTDHVGIVTGYDESTGYISTVEGNTGSGTSCVSASRYPYNWSYINGYGVPAY